MFKLLITGSRDWTDKDMIRKNIETFIKVFGDDLIIVHGNCPTGADKIADDVCIELHIPVIRYNAYWDKYGRAAGPMRNQQMVNSGVGMVVAYPLGKSSGTRGCMEMAERAGIPVHVNEEEPTN